MRRLLQYWLTEQAGRQPDKPAVVTGSRVLSYGELESRSNRLAWGLQDAGCRQGDRICFMMPKSVEAYVAIFGILKAGGIYVPLDPEGPAIRSLRMINQSGARWILAAGNVEGKLENLLSKKELEAPLTVGWIDLNTLPEADIEPAFTTSDLERFADHPPECQTRPDDPASILFTSGSTGQPKGVVNTHSNIIHFIDWAREYFGIEQGDRLSGHPPLHFDMSSLDMYGAVSSGAELHPVPSRAEYHLFPNKLADFIRERRITQWFSVPSVLNLLAKFDVLKKDGFPGLKRLLWCGEVMPTSSLIYFMKRLPHVAFTNLYGPTETTIASSYYTVPACPEDKTAEIPIGKACKGERLHVLDEHMRPVEKGTKGDLYISGVGVGLGYWEAPGKTEEVFLPNPFASDGGRRIYKTGDLASIGENGLIYFHGRADSQIKSRGFRIELGEIENALISLNSIMESAVVAIPSNEFEGKRICCAFAPHPGHEVSNNNIRDELSEFLPDYMIPTKWHKFDRLPKNKNGKIDKKSIEEKFSNHETAGNAY